MPEVMPIRPDDPQRVGRYRLTGRVGRLSPGHSASGVFMGTTVNGGAVLVVLLGPTRAPDPAARDRFTAEARSARRIAPYCAVNVLDAGFEGAEPYLVTEFAPGPTLADAIGDEGPPPPDVLFALAVGAATGLASIHRAGLVHGEFGPDSLVLTSRGPQVIHFAVTPPYGAATPAADMLAWAHTVAFAGMGRPLGSLPDLDRLPEDLAAPIAACLNPDPTARPSARAVVAQLLDRDSASAGLLSAGAAQASAAAWEPARPAPQTGSRPRRRSRQARARWLAPVAVGCTALLVTAVIVAFISSRHRSGASPQAAHPQSPGATPRIPARFAGRWSGQVHQTDPDLTVIVRLDLPANSTSGTVAYPALGCSGSVTVTDLNSSTLTVRQTIDSGRKNCEDGVIKLVPATGGLHFAFGPPGGASPTGVLSRSS